MPAIETCKIFLVDDDVKTLITFRGALERKLDFPIEISIFAYGENCLERMTEEKPDIVVLDFYLNAIQEKAQTGIEILKKAKELSPQSKIIMISGQEDMETALECIRNGAYDYIIKNERALQHLELSINKIRHEQGK